MTFFPIDNAHIYHALWQTLMSKYMRVDGTDFLTYETAIREIEKLKKENEMLSLNIQELTRTNEFLVSATWREREIKTTLHNALEELKVTKQIVDAQNKNITDSINYASRIQDAIIPKLSDIREKFKGIFIYHEAKDIVSGDFPWIFDANEHTYVAAVDCTGHGVPGAMMSLIGHLLLNDLVKQDSPDPASLLTRLHWGVVKTLKQDGEVKHMADGMDIALCRITPDNRLEFSGAHRPLYHVSNGTLQVYNGDRYPIGGNQYKGKNSFSNHSIPVKPDDCIYFFSDGLTDQFGGPAGQKIGSKRIQDILLQNSHLDMQTQYERLRSACEEWRGENKKIDDVLAIGIRF